jgi:hypothetical protein
LIMTLASSTSYTPAGVVFDVVLILIGIGITVDFRKWPRHVHAIMGIAWTRMGEQGSFSALVRIYLFLGALPFWVTRLFFLVALVGGGAESLAFGPH